MSITTMHMSFSMILKFWFQLYVPNIFTISEIFIFFISEFEQNHMCFTAYKIPVWKFSLLMDLAKPYFSLY